jgi:DNA-binding response OmpR family regulator
MTKRILVVDDEPDIVGLVSYHLETEEYHVVRVSSGLEALHQARRDPPDLILLDLMLPDLDGFSICEILSHHPSTREIPVILLTAMAGELPRLHGFEVGAADYCIKPIRPRDLKARVRNALETGAARRSLASEATATVTLPCAG